MTHDLRCPHCYRIDSRRDVRDKLAWQCDCCKRNYEINTIGEIKPLPLTKSHKVRLCSSEGGNCCTGFGGKAGEI